MINRKFYCWLQPHPTLKPPTSTLKIDLINVSVVFFIKAARHIQKPLSIQLFGEPIPWTGTTQWYIAALCNSHVSGHKEISLNTGHAFLNQTSGLSFSNSSLLYKQITLPIKDYGPALMSGSCRWCNPSVFTQWLTPWNIGSEHIHEDFEVMPLAEILSITMLRLSNNTGEPYKQNPCYSYIASTWQPNNDPRMQVTALSFWLVLCPVFFHPEYDNCNVRRNVGKSCFQVA
jgi:hypothetical protein